jgi:SpoVK/Ycf46/Vps4 family AAA+-type ATPase
VYSKYIGETEKNLAKLLSKVNCNDSVLFFDEADALFGGLSSVRDSHGNYANQEVSYLLQCMEKSPGISILAIDQFKNLDDAFLRRFHSLVHFPGPARAKGTSSRKTR